jgi:hypothetical protein
VTQPEVYTDPELSVRVRDAVHSALLRDHPAAAVAEGPDATAAAAMQLSALLESTEQDRLTAPETALLLQWLTKLAARQS